MKPITIDILILVFSFVFAKSVHAQEGPYVLEATTDKNVFLFFPSPISKALPGNGDFRFGYNLETAEKFGVLKAVAPRGESTLHIITENQAVYSFIVKYNGDTSKFEYFFDGSEAVGSLKAKPTIVADNGSIESTYAAKIIDADYYEGKREIKAAELDFCKELVNRKEYYKNIYKRQNDVVLRLSNIAYRDDKTYLYLTIENQSTLDYDLNFIQFNKIAKKVTKKSTFQAIEVRPILESSFQPFKRIGSMEIKKAVYVFDKISIDKNKLISIEINELKGERNLKLAVGDQYINNPNK